MGNYIHLFLKKIRQILRLNSISWSNEWKKWKESKGIILYTMKTQDSDIIVTKYEAQYKVPWRFLYDYFSNIENQMAAYKDAEIYIRHDVLLTDTNGYGEYRVFTKYPFPFANREDCWSFFSETEDKKGYVIQDELKHITAVPREKGFVRTIRSIGGYILEEHPKNPKHAVVTSVLNVSAGGSIPTWLVNMWTSLVMKVANRMKKMLEKKYEIEHKEEI